MIDRKQFSMAVVKAESSSVYSKYLSDTADAGILDLYSCQSLRNDKKEEEYTASLSENQTSISWASPTLIIADRENIMSSQFKI